MKLACCPYVRVVVVVKVPVVISFGKAFEVGNKVLSQAQIPYNDCAIRTDFEKALCSSDMLGEVCSLWSSRYFAASLECGCGLDMDVYALTVGV